jgi:hypothetical protein
VTASGASPLSFQWQKNGIAIAGATNATYDTPNSSMDDNGATYNVVVTNNLGTALSNSATLSVFAAAAPVITAQPASQVAVVGQTVQFSVTATGSPTLRYQWEKNGVSIPGATTPSYTTPVLTLDDNGATYTVLITNPVDKVTSSPATLTVIHRRRLRLPRSQGMSRYCPASRQLSQFRLPDRLRSFISGRRTAPMSAPTRPA